MSRKRLQGYIKQQPLYSGSKFIMRFRLMTAWVEHGRILIVHEVTGEYTSVDVQTWYERAKALRNEAENAPYADQRAQITSVCHKMLQLAKYAMQQPQPPIIWHPGQAATAQKKARIVVPGRIESDEPPKPLIIPGREAVTTA